MTSGRDADRLGELVGGKYRVTRLLARGGMGVVYEAQHAVVHRRFAIKFLRRDLAERRDILARFQREAETAGALQSENVTAAVDFGVSQDGAPYIVMEYLVGESLGDLLQRVGRLPLERAAELVMQACRGVAAAHAAGIVHRDLKPHNLFVSRRDDGGDLLKILDFGVAKLQALEDAGSATRTGTLLGTAAYMAPEQARGDSVIDHRADVYALGAVLYELVSLKRPHPGDSQNAILHHIATQPAVPLGAVQADLPPAFIDVVERALASDPAARPASAEEMARELGPFARRQVWPAGPADAGLAPGEPPSSPPAGSDVRSGPEGPPRAVASPGPVREQAPPGTAPPSRRRRAKWLVGGSLLVLALGLVLARVRTSEPPGAAAQDGARAQAPAPRRTTEDVSGGARAAEPGPRGESSPGGDPPPKPEARSPSPEAPFHPAPDPAAPAAVMPTANVDRPGSGGRPRARKGTSAGRPSGRASQPAPPAPPKTPAPPTSRPAAGDRNLLGPAFDSVNPYE